MKTQASEIVIISIEACCCCHYTHPREIVLVSAGDLSRRLCSLLKRPGHNWYQAVHITVQFLFCFLVVVVVVVDAVLFLFVVGFCGDLFCLVLLFWLVG